MWDPILLIAQIVSLQSLHYLTLSVILPPLLYTFSDTRAIAYTHGGAATVGMVMDWREMAGLPALAPPSVTLAESSANTFWTWMPSAESFPFLGHGDLDAHVTQHKGPSGRLTGGWKESMLDYPIVRLKSRRRPSSHISRDESSEETEREKQLAKATIRDPLRSWVISVAWLLACGVDIYIVYTLIRRPTLVLDFSLTLILNHTILTTYYAASFPTSLFFWLIMGGGAMLIIILAEQLCVRREMREGLKAITTTNRDRRRSRVIEEELFNATALEQDDEPIDASDSELDVEDERGHERIELMERGGGPSVSKDREGRHTTVI